MPQKHKATVPDSVLGMEMNALESKLTGPGVPLEAHLMCHIMARDPQAHDSQSCLGSAGVENVRLHDTGFGGAGTRLPPPPQVTRNRPVRL
jgi:hypothetical protein